MDLKRGSKVIIKTKDIYLIGTIIILRSDSKIGLLLNNGRTVKCNRTQVIGNTTEEKKTEISEKDLKKYLIHEKNEEEDKEEQEEKHNVLSLKDVEPITETDPDEFIAETFKQLKAKKTGNHYILTFPSDFSNYANSLTRFLEHLSWNQENENTFTKELDDKKLTIKYAKKKQSVAFSVNIEDIQSEKVEKEEPDEHKPVTRIMHSPAQTYQLSALMKELETLTRNKLGLDKEAKVLTKKSETQYILEKGLTLTEIEETLLRNDWDVHTINRKKIFFKTEPRAKIDLEINIIKHDNKYNLMVTFAEETLYEETVDPISVKLTDQLEAFLNKNKSLKESKIRIKRQGSYVIIIKAVSINQYKEVLDILVLDNWKVSHTVKLNSTAPDHMEHVLEKKKHKIYLAYEKSTDRWNTILSTKPIDEIQKMN